MLLNRFLFKEVQLSSLAGSAFQRPSFHLVEPGLIYAGHQGATEEGRRVARAHPGREDNNAEDG